MENIKITVIMPVYNVEDFVGKTIESVLNQTLKEIEFYAIDDGATDKSGEICDRYAKSDERLIVIHKVNGGAPEARNVAIEKAKGKYMYFIDSDDWIEEDYLEKMYNMAEENEADVVCTGFYMEYYQNGKDVTYSTECDDKIYNLNDFKRNAHKYLNNSILSLPWNKLYKSNIIMNNSIRFPKTKWDDHHFNMDYFMHVNKVVMSSIKKYHWYRSRKGSETMINYSDPKMFYKRKEHYEHIIKLYKYWGNLDSEVIDSINSYYVGRLVQCIQELSDNIKIEKEEKKALVREILNDKKTIEALNNSKSLSKKFKIFALFMKLRNVNLCLFMGKCMSLVRKMFPTLFIKMKEKEVHGKK